MKSNLVLYRRAVMKSILGGALACAVPMRAWAHRQKQALTTITWNPEAKLLQVTHDLHAHDAELALARLGLINSPDITNLRARATLALYSQKHFKLQMLDGKNIPLTIIGAETDSNYAHIYLETELNVLPDGILVTDTLLQDVFVDQINQVNVTFFNTIKTVVFVAGSGQKKVLA